MTEIQTGENFPKRFQTGVKAQFHCLHGFLGKPQDWSAFFPDSSLHYDLFSAARTPYPANLVEWGDAINRDATVTPRPRILLGYSLGGRIALHALAQGPELWSAAVIISAHPGLSSASEKKERLKQDEMWARRFVSDDWTKLMQDWNAQSIFAGLSQQRVEKEFSRSILSRVLVSCSLGQQQDLRPSIQAHRIPILWISGERDAKYRAIADEVVEIRAQGQNGSQTGIYSVCIPNAGHRVPWDQPKAFRDAIEKFIFNLGLEMPEKSQPEKFQKEEKNEF